MAFVTMRKSKSYKGTLYAGGGRHEIKEAATAAELHALARNGDGAVRAFQDSAPVWARKVVRVVTYYYNVAPHIKLLVSINVRLSYELATVVLGRIDELNAELMLANWTIWLHSDGTETLDRFVQLFGKDAEARKPIPGTPQNYYLEFAYSAEHSAIVETIERGVVELFGYLVSLDRLEPEKI